MDVLNLEQILKNEKINLHPLFDFRRIVRSGCLPHRVWIVGFSAGAEEAERVRHTQVDS